MDSISFKTYVPSSKAPVTVPFGNERRDGISKMQEKRMAEQLKKAEEKIDANINAMTMNFEEIEKSNHKATGDPVLCGQCSCYFNCNSHYDTASKTWICEFCNHPNKVDIDPDEMPKSLIETYVDPNQEEIKGAASPEANSSSIVIFCVDLSGSMDESSRCYQNIKYMQRSGYVTRLQLVKVAIDSHLDNLSRIKIKI